jgi:DNA invertase Pin-like site-specific DNA recombinase
MAHTTPAQLRAEAEAAIQPLGRKRLRLQEQLDELEQQLRPLVVRALDMEVAERRITELTGFSRTTFRRWKAER